MKLHLISIFLPMFACVAFPAESRSAHDAGRRDYAAGEFKKAASHFHQALKVNPSDADSSFWLGKSYEMLADIGGPLMGARASAKAHLYLGKALQLDPDNEEYRRELFQLLITTDRSPGALRQAESIIQMTPESNADYPFMLMRLHQEHEARSSPESRVLSAFAVMPQEFARLAQ
jgi:tetratricopeptide (TPR) repeat protein